MFARTLAMGILLGCLHAPGIMAGEIETPASPPSDAGRVTEVFFSAAGTQLAGNLGLWGLDRAGAGLEVLVPMAIVWPSISALVAWAVGDASPDYRASYGAMFLGSYLGLVAAGVIAGVVTTAIVSSSGFVGFGAAVLLFRLAWTIGPAAGQAIAFSSSREAEDEIWRRNVAR